MSANLSRILLAAGALCLLAAPSAAGELRGTFLSEKGSAISLAEVQVCDHAGDCRTEITDSYGRIYVEGLSSGDYTVRLKDQSRMHHVSVGGGVAEMTFRGD